MNTTNTYRYSVSNQEGQGWAIAFIDDAGCFSVLSDYGNYAYRWHINGLPVGQNLREFLIGCDDIYLIGKLGFELRKEYDAEKTLQNVKYQILHLRRLGMIEKEVARDEWQRLEEHANLNLEWNFHDWALGGLEGFHDDMFSLACYGPNRGLLAFIKNAWPRLKAEIKADLDKQPA